MTIVFAADNHYCQHLAVAIVSLLERNPGEIIDLRVINAGIDASHQVKLRAMVEGYKNASLKFIEFDVRLVESFRVDNYINGTAYARLFMPQLIEPEIAKVLYLDCDLVVNDSLRLLWTTDLTGKSAAAVVDLGRPDKDVLGIPGEQPYVNSGVLLINLSYWRDNRATERMVDFLLKNREVCRLHDQDAINAIVGSDIVLLPPRWNVFQIYYENEARFFEFTDQFHRELKRRPSIVHFSSADKPWLYLNAHPWRSIYWRFLAKTPYKEYGAAWPFYRERGERCWIWLESIHTRFDHYLRRASSHIESLCRRDFTQMRSLMKKKLG